MSRQFGFAALLLAVVVMSVSARLAAEDKKEEKLPSIKECMKFQGGKGVAQKVEAAAKADKWEEAQKLSAELHTLGVALGKNTPTKNADKTDKWEELTTAFREKTKAVDDAAQAKKLEDVSKAVAALHDMKTCAACHSMFRAKK